MQIVLRFEDSTEKSMGEAVSQMAEGSAFKPHPSAFVSFFGSLHRYSADQINSTLDANPKPLRGRFLRWEIVARSAQLRAVVELEPVGCEALLGHLEQAFPKGTRWRSHYLTCGSLAAIDPSLHADFLAAVEAAFPIDPNAYFSTRDRLELKNDEAPPPKLKAPPLIRLPPAGVTAPKKSPHKKWVRPQIAEQLLGKKKPPMQKKPSQSEGMAPMDVASHTGVTGLGARVVTIHKRRGRARGGAARA